VVDALAITEAKPRRHARVEPDGPKPHVEVQGDPERKLGRDLGPVREADLWEAGGAEEDRVRGLAHFERLARQLFASAPVAAGARFHLLEGELELARHGDGVEDLDRLVDDLGADTVPGEHRDAIERHGQLPGDGAIDVAGAGTAVTGGVPRGFA